MGCAAWAWYGWMDGWKIEIWHTSLTGSKKHRTARLALLFADWRADGLELMIMAFFVFVLCLESMLPRLKGGGRAVVMV